MTANLIAILGTALSGLLFAVVEWIKLGQAKSDGAKLEAGKVSAVTAGAEARIAAAVVSAPSTVAATVDALDKGSF